MKVAIGGSRRIPTGLASRLLVRFLLKLDEDTVVLLRTPASKPPSQFERDVSVACDILGLEVEWRPPHPEETPGRASVFRRDIEMVAAADLVVLFLAAEDVESGYSGTYHLFEKALDEQRPVYAWQVGDGTVVDRMGEWDPANTFAHLFA